MSAAARSARCLVCAGTDWELFVQADDWEYGCRPPAPATQWELIRCRACGHVQLDPLPQPAEVAALYPPTYYTVNPASPIYMEGATVEHKMARDAVNLRALLGNPVVKSVVDVGGGNLTRLVKLKEAFGAREAVCLDLQFDDSVLAAARAAGVTPVVGNVETDLAALRDGGHELIVLRQLIEHLRDPRAALTGLIHKLTPGGHLVIDTPNRGGWDYWLFPRRYWGGWHIPRHFHIFDRPALARLCRESGYEILRHDCTPSIAFWIVSLRNWAGLNSAARTPSWLEFQNLKNLPLVGGFYVFDLLWSKLGGATSNQFLVARRPY
jgi:SAM-dependent methyltransferase